MKLKKNIFVLTILIIINLSVGCVEEVVNMEQANRICNAWAYLTGGVNNAPPARWPVGLAVAGSCWDDQPIPFPNATFCTAVMCRNTSDNCHCSVIIGNPKRAPDYIPRPGNPNGPPFLTQGDAFFGDSVTESNPSAGNPQLGPKVVITQPNINAVWLAPLSQSLVLQFDHRIDPSTLSLSGTLVGNQTPKVQVSSTLVTDDTISLTPLPNWSAGNRNLQVNVKDLAGNLGTSSMGLNVGAVECSQPWEPCNCRCDFMGFPVPCFPGQPPTCDQCIKPGC
ncbi:Ig-like domain-containing protein [Leptospira interrogans]|uniref:Ig-like domain-containing protein n=1 Tax=Leptospira interrogans TaxID=173 RepID=UPI0002BA98C9|nr:Ig-like domain-containing protein [Leptospira interrogans]MCR8649102.1 Ig-like protein [Leptospira interrogans serovar Bataviae]OAM86566.1 Ig-like protein [Leptospira interrogans serovar Bataviae]QOI38460.1 Ig-like protein [Leptospira interrogans serovar Bataviae]QYY62011.1 Ig-like domain-containing protein [Leptospira interrogans serovar Bataviae]